ncbi:MAG: hypothetical protein JWR69_353 [Pedosphaera sp.]|nr:hypothetical protein [Pedosphaera sp.]
MKVYLLVLSMLAGLVAGCASHGPSRAERDLSECKSVCVTVTDPFDQLYVEQVARSLKESGFNVVGDPNQPNTLICTATSSQEGTFDWGFQITLWRGGKKVVTAEARNGDIGSLGQPQTAKFKVVQDAFEHLQVKLQDMRRSNHAALKG